MKSGHEMKPRNAKGDPIRALAAAVFARGIVSGLLLLLLAFILYKAEPGEPVDRKSVV